MAAFVIGKLGNIWFFTIDSIVAFGGFVILICKYI